MPGIRLRDGEPIDGALKKLKRQIEKAGIISDLKRREAYEKPSVAKKRKLALWNGAIFPLGEFKRTMKDHLQQIKFDVVEQKCRFRSLGCVPCSGAVKSDAENVVEIIKELTETQTSERHTRLIDKTSGSAMEMKKREGYF